MALPCLELNKNVFRIYRVPTSSDTECSHLRLVFNEQGTTTGTEAATGTINFVPVVGSEFLLLPSKALQDPSINHVDTREFVYKGFDQNGNAIFREIMYVKPPSNG